jgi:hypothetical protein
LQGIGIGEEDGGVDRDLTAPGWIAHIASDHSPAPTAPRSGPRITSPRPRSSQVNSANPDHEKRRRADFVVDTSRGFEAARAQVRAILDAVATMPKRRR